MTTYAVLPDVEKALVDFLAAHAALVPLHGGRVSTELATPELACLQVTSLGGQQPWPWEATPEFQLSVWGGSGPGAKAAANELARTVVAVAFELAGAAITGGRIVGAAVRLAPLWSPAEDTGRARYRVDIALTVMP
jgi:hypothetical protein